MLWNEAKSDAAIDMAYLETCIPAIKEREMEALMASAKQVLSAVLSLYDKLLSIHLGAIPSELEVVFSLVNAIWLATNDADHSLRAHTKLTKALLANPKF